MLPTDPRAFRDVSLALIDRPELDARINRDPEFLDELTADIARRGVLVPLIVVQTGDRFEVVDGFTRYIACVRLNLAQVPCCIYPTKDAALEGVKYSATQLHENFTPADEAIFFHELFQNECGGDIERVAATVHKKVSYVDKRLQLVQGDPDVFEAVKAKRITLGVAELLNQIDKPDWRAYYLIHAIKTGVTVSVMQAWKTEYLNNHADRSDLPQRSDEPGSVTIAMPVYDPNKCHVCGKSDHRLCQTVSVHASCREAILDPLLATYRGDV